MCSVLVIDESFDSAIQLCKTLEELGHNVVLTVEPQRGLSLCNDIAFDIVICGLELRESPTRGVPSLTLGMETMAAIIGKFPEVPLLALDNLQSTELKLGSSVSRLGAKGTVRRDDQGLDQVIERAIG